MFSEKDIKQIKSKNLTLEKVKNQINIFKTGIPFAKLVKAATVGDGILKPAENENNEYVSFFDKQKNNISVLKFVPASGAASRMFKFLFKFFEDFNPERDDINSVMDHKNLHLFFNNLEKFPFNNKVLIKLKEVYPNYNELDFNQKSHLFVKTMLDENLLNYGSSPKGLLPFHEYKNKVVSSAFEEHLHEAVLYASENKNAKLHFTISEKHQDMFYEEFEKVNKKVTKRTGKQFEVSYSFQKQSTDTIAVTLENMPFRNEDDSILFRPSGHGALLENLNELDADVILMKNVDNVVVSKYKNEIAKYKKVLAGILLQLQLQAFKYITDIDSGYLTPDNIDTIAEFLQTKMNVTIESSFVDLSETQKVVYLKEKLNKPIRVCGMVKNEGEPGGGPFWVKDENGDVSLQIVESAQVDLKNKEQEEILKKSTHFNPVDVVCGIKDYKGNKFDLTKFVDHKAAFISNKTSGGKNLKALELPGLWNGSMANWNTIFVEVPLITFNPVKTVNDLLKDAHQINS